MTAELLRGPDQCGSCARTMREGDLGYRVTRARLLRCEPCAKGISSALPVIAIPKPRPQREDFQRFAWKAMKAGVDWRKRQAGER